MSMKKTRVKAVLMNMINMCDQDEMYAEDFSFGLEELLNEMQSNDAFGTEGQCDPRGDFRDGHWSMDQVQAIDS